MFLPKRLALIHDFSDNSIRKLKTDRADSLKIANYALTFWNQLPPFNDEDETRLVLKEQSRMYERLASTATSLRNGLIASADQTFPSIDQAFGHAIKNADGHEKWVDFFSIYWHRDCVLRLSIEKFTESYRKWCLRRNYKFRTNTAHKLYALAQDAVPTLPKNNGTKALVLQACKSLNAVGEAKQSTQEEMNRLASLLPEYEVVMQMEGCGSNTGPCFQWLRLVTSDVSKTRKLSLPLPALMHHRSNLETLNPSHATFPSAAHLI